MAEANRWKFFDEISETDKTFYRKILNDVKWISSDQGCDTFQLQIPNIKRPLKFVIPEDSDDDTRIQCLKFAYETWVRLNPSDVTRECQACGGTLKLYGRSRAVCKKCHTSQPLTSTPTSHDVVENPYYQPPSAPKSEMIDPY